MMLQFAKENIYNTGPALVENLQKNECVGSQNQYKEREN